MCHEEKKLPPSCHSWRAQHGYLSELSPFSKSGVAGSGSFSGWFQGAADTFLALFMHLGDSGRARLVPGLDLLFSGAWSGPREGTKADVTLQLFSLGKFKQHVLQKNTGRSSKHRNWQVV